MAFLLRCNSVCPSFHLVKLISAVRIDRFGTSAILRNSAQDGGDNKGSPSSEEVLHMMRNFSREKQQQRAQRRDRGFHPNRNDMTANAVRSSNMQRSSETADHKSASSQRSMQMRNIQPEPLSIFERLTNHLDNKLDRANRPVGPIESPSPAAVDESEAPKEPSVSTDKPLPGATMKRITVEKELATRSQWITKLQDKGTATFEEFQQGVARPRRESDRNITKQQANTSDGSMREDESNEVDSLYRSIQLEITGHDEAVLRSYAEFLRMTTHGLGITDSLERIWTTPRRFYRRTLLKSNFVHKLHRRQYEIRTYYLLARLVRLTGSTTETFLEYVQRNLPEGTAMKVTYERIEPLPSRILQMHAISASQSSSNTSELTEVQSRAT